MSLDCDSKKRHHNPVDSICRKIKSIQRMDQVSKPALQIPKFQSQNFDSSQCHSKKNLEEILKGRTSRGWNVIFSASRDSDSANLPCPMPTSDSCSGNATTLFPKSNERFSSSRVFAYPLENSSPYCFGSREASEQNKLCASSNADVQPKQKYLTSSPNVNFFRSDKKPESAVIQPPVPKTSSLSERGGRQTVGYKAGSVHDVSLICEEDLLTTIFHACDIDRTGKVPVSQIMDYLRHISSWRSEDSSLEDICGMLDPEHRDISLDLETYHAILGDWNEDCKSKWEDGATEKSSASTEDLEFQIPKSVSEAKKTHVWMNATSGSLEAFGGDMSKGDMETSDLVTCIADLQYQNRKLQEENTKLKLMVEAVDETNNKLLADNDHLHQQIKSIQPSVLKAKSLEEELEDMRNNLNLSEEKREQALQQNKQHEKEIQSLNNKVTSFQEEITRKSTDMEGLQKRILELSKNAAQLQVKAHVCESIVEKKEENLIQKEQHIKELKLTIVECSSIIEALQAEKNEMLENMHHMQEELILHGLNLSLLCKFNSNIPARMNSLHWELELAQSPEIIRPGWMSLDETLDHEVLLLLQGPEHAGEKIKTIMKNLQEEASEAEELVMTSLQWAKDPDEDVQKAWERKLVALKQELGEKIHHWTQKLQLLEKCVESSHKDFAQMAGNLRRTKTEQFHLMRELSARLREVEAAKQHQEETASQAEALGLELQEARRQLEDANQHAEDQVEAFHSACEEAASLKSKLEEAISEQQKLKVIEDLASTCQQLWGKVEDQKKAANAMKWELLCCYKRRLCELQCQQLQCSKQPWSEGPTWYSEAPWALPLGLSLWHSSPLLDALNLETSCPNNSAEHNWDRPWRQSPGSCSLGRWDVGRVSTSGVTLQECRWEICSAGDSSDEDLPVSITMMDSSLDESAGGESTLPAGLIPASDPLTSAQEALASSAESTAPAMGCLATEERSPKGLREREEDVPTPAATEKSGDKDAAAPGSGPTLIKRDFCPVMEELQPVFQNVLKQDLDGDQEQKNNKERSEEASAVVPSRKGSSPTAGGIKGDKTKQNELDSPNEKEVEAEFLRLSLGFKCDLFTLDKRVRLEERSRDLAEENLKKEITNAVKMLEALVPLCEEDNEAQEIIKKLQKSLQFLSQYAARVASRAEMLGAINQESRVSKAVEVMIQHVENLKRTYARERAELTELKQLLLQNDRSFSSLGDRDESTNKKLPSPFNFKPSSALRRVSIATVPRSAGNAGIGLPLAQPHDPDGDERSDRFSRRSSSWGRLGVKQNEKRPSLQRFLSTYSWAEYEEEPFETKNEQLDSPEEAQDPPTRKESVSEKGKYSSKWTLESVYNLMSSWASHCKASFSNANKTFWVFMSILVLLAALVSFLMGLSLQRPADAAPVGTGDSWKSLQQLLWPYTGLRHNGPPPV